MKYKGLQSNLDRLNPKLPDKEFNEITDLLLERGGYVENKKKEKDE